MKNLPLLADKFELDQSHLKSTQAIAGTCKSWPNGVVTCIPVWPGLSQVSRSYLKIPVVVFAEQLQESENWLHNQDFRGHRLHFMFA